eukprot:COSAG01_NODE_430_length_17153_cov_24.866717_3_plen_69_part_00
MPPEERATTRAKVSAPPPTHTHTHTHTHATTRCQHRRCSSRRSSPTHTYTHTLTHPPSARKARVAPLM